MCNHRMYPESKRVVNNCRRSLAYRAIVPQNWIEDTFNEHRLGTSTVYLLKLFLTEKTFLS